MKHILVCVAMLSLATTGCAGNRMLGGSFGGQASGVSTSQNAARTQNQSNLGSGYQQCSYDGCCDVGCGCDTCSDACCGCDATCGCDTGCEPSCSGCDGCCDPYGNGCADGCACGPGGCQLGGGRGGIGNGRGGIGNGRGNTCSSCGGRGCNACGGSGIVGAIASGFCPHAGGYPESYNFTPGPPVGQTAYPYYTVRGPRDFLQNNPPSIGPY